MKNILIPTDFSSTAENAMKYAAAFAKKMNAKIILFNVYPIPTYVTETGLPMEASVNEELKLEAETSIKQALKKVHALEPGLEADSAISWGFAGDEIVDNAKQKKVDLIIMGTEGASGMKRFFLGSNTAEVINKANCPVLAVPNGYMFKNIKHIAFATDYFDYEIPSIKIVAELAKQFNATLTLVHIEDSIMNKMMEKEMIDNFIKKVKVECNQPGIKSETLKEQEIVKGLTWFTDNQLVDLLVMAHKKRNVITQLINPSIARKASFVLTTPLLCLPATIK